MSRRPRRRGRRARDEETAGERQHRAVVSFHAHHNTTKIAKFHLNSAKNFSLYVGATPVRSPPYPRSGCVSLERAPRYREVTDETTSGFLEARQSGNGTRQAGPICRSARLAAAWVIGTRNGRACDDFRALHGVRFGGGGKPSRRPERRGEVATEKFPGTGGAPCRGGKRPDGLRRSRAART